MYLETVVRYFSRYHKYTLVNDLRSKSRDVVETVIVEAWLPAGDIPG